MKIGYRSSNDTRHSRPLFVVVSKFDTDSFPVRVRHLQLGQTKALKTPSGVSSLERRGIPQRRRQRKLNPIDVVPKPPDVARRIAGSVSTLL